MNEGRRKTQDEEEKRRHHEERGAGLVTVQKSGHDVEVLYLTKSKVQ